MWTYILHIIQNNSLKKNLWKVLTNYVCLKLGQSMCISSWVIQKQIFLSIIKGKNLFVISNNAVLRWVFVLAFWILYPLFVRADWVPQQCCNITLITWYITAKPSQSNHNLVCCVYHYSWHSRPAAPCCKAVSTAITLHQLPNSTCTSVHRNLLKIHVETCILSFYYISRSNGKNQSWHQPAFKKTIKQYSHSSCNNIMRVSFVSL
jgi:hypothetical protein